ncbi:MAG: putative sulfate exporter family transporter [Betaproteobacteria bacterium]|jgi:uncharacterized integral membrane protein (TIGR00698 family)|nr:putative sulfate exporter family transporter [Betaproteobacteria bacterium]
MTIPHPSRVSELRSRFPGVLLCVVIALASSLISQSYGGPLFLYALLIGMAFNSILQDSALVPGIQWTTSTLLRTGVALLGLRLGLDMVHELGALPFVVVLTGVGLTLATGQLIGPWLGRSRAESVLASGAVAICGASAAMAIAAALPNSQERERMTLFTVVGVTALSTACMVLYPMLAHALDFSAQEAALLFGGTIHDVAQVVGAAMVYGGAGASEMASYTKLLRVALLAPLVLTVGIVFGTTAVPGQPEQRRPLLPGFLVGFFVCFALVNLTPVPAQLVEGGKWLSQSLILLAVAGLGVKTSLYELRSLGWRPMALLVACTLVVLATVLTLILLNR